jgi:hypothetical protein
MYECGSSGRQRPWHPKARLIVGLALRSKPQALNTAKDQTHNFLIPDLLVISAACLFTVFIGSIVLEAFDSDLDLWPFGAENFTLDAHGLSPSDSQPSPSCAALFPFLCFVMTAGAHLIVQHRARGALAAESPSILLAFNVAEPREQNLQATLPLGHFFVGSRLTTGLCPPLRRVAARISVPS